MEKGPCLTTFYTTIYSTLVISTSEGSSICFLVAQVVQSEKHEKESMEWELNDMLQREGEKRKERLTFSTFAHLHIPDGCSVCGRAHLPGEPAIWIVWDPNYKQTSGEMPQVSQQGKCWGGRKVPDSQSFPENNNIHCFPYIFHLKKNQKQACRQGKKALARFQMLIALIYIYCCPSSSLRKIRVVSYSLEVSALQVESCRKAEGK